MSDIDLYQSLLRQTHQITERNQQELTALKLATAFEFSPFHFIPWGEVPVTHMLAFFLNHTNQHGQQGVFQQHFLQELRKLLPSRHIPEDTYNVVAEKRHGGGNYGQIDLLLTGRQHRFAICLENKPHDSTGDTPRQLEAYHEYLTGVGGFGDGYILLYLSRTTRHPAPTSLSTDQREQLTASGHYRNITYQEFLLPLLSSWSGRAHAPKVKEFLLDFRFQIETQLHFPTTSPMPTVNHAEIAKLLLNDPNLLEAAYQLPTVLQTAEQQLREKFAGYVLTVARELGLQLVSCPADVEAFKNFVNESPCALARPTWGEYAIGLEFSGATLDVGVIGGGTGSAVSQYLAAGLGGPKSSPAWAWWSALYDSDFSAIYLDIASGAIAEKMKAKFSSIAALLDQFTQDGILN
ncbi:PD-(D/E)XK nuclease family protein [Hymenobacter edaphi]|uniref:PD-(D/E)XK nuclease family protein n=1 Tax=Hymenobacter edaphi TaxID=2211146 RepID=A0A328BTD4_9BACT|nr:PD-(D/E)XK nuclease family protein [Hymenobacter edaphi]RAK70560.1 hypothetical protein DLM85_06915 [Hymenobacter edaphi]